MKYTAFSTEFVIDDSLVEASEEEIQKQLEQYFSGSREAFDFEVDFPESFTGRVMREMSKISYGGTRSYGEIAGNLDSSAVAVGQACGRNPVPILVPCHRVVGKNSLGGYSLGLELKEKFLRLEGADF